MVGSSGPRSPRFLQRSRSGTPRICHASYTPETPLFPPNANPGRVSAVRSNSTSKTRGEAVEADTAGLRQKPKENLAAGTKTPGMGWSRAPPVPSAWALSPGRSSEVVAERPGSGELGGGGKRRVGGVLGFFRQRKAPSAKDEASHQLRVLLSGLVQWRFVNARAEVAMQGCKTTAENKLYYMWIRIGELRKLVAAKRVVVQRVKHHMKLCEILKPQIQILNQCDHHHTTNKRSLDVVAMFARVLKTACITVPLVEGAKANSEQVGRTISTAIDVMTEIEATIPRLFSKVENINLLLSELVRTQKQEIEGLEELIKTASTVASLEIDEISLRATLIQVAKDEKVMPLNTPNLALSTMRMY